MTHDYHNALPAGARIECYEIKEVLGVGGFGITYKGFDHSLHHDVAIKEYLPSDMALRATDRTTVIPKSETDKTPYEDGLRRFLDEARILAKFREPNIVRVIRFLQCHGTAYMVMDYEEGEPLSGYIQDGHSFTEREIKGIIIPILNGLRVVHAKNFLHRDIKPGNIYLRKTGSPVLLDFGAAWQGAGSRRSAMITMVTPGYAPYEQYYTLDDYGPWSDVYATGATIYHCITGVAPVTSTDRVAAIRAGKRDPIGDLAAAFKGRYSAAFLDAITWMLQPFAKDRPQTVDQALEGLLKQDSGPRNTALAPHNVATPASYDAEIPRTMIIDPSADDYSSAEQEVFSTAFIDNSSQTSAGPEQARDTSNAVEPRVNLDKSVLQAAEESLADYIGPVARVLVSRAAKKAVTPDKLFQLLADEIPDAEQKKLFLRAVTRKFLSAANPLIPN